MKRTTTTTLATLALLGVLVGCGQDDGADAARDDSGGSTQDGGAADDESPPDAGADDGAAGSGDELDADGQPCPASLPEAPGAAVTDPAAAAPDLPDAAEAWVCRYDPAEVPDGPAWQRSGEPVAVSPADLPALDGLAPAAAGRFCTEEIGPRWMIVLATDAGDLTGVVVDDFGCGDVTLTDDPSATAPGTARQDGVTGGVLTGPDGLATDLAALYGG